MSENWTFFKQWLKNPTQLGTFLPIQETFAKRVVQNLVDIHKLDKIGTLNVLELGAGTGRITKILIDEGFRHITAVEVDPNLTQFMRERFHKSVNILNINAMDLPHQVSPKSVDIIISILPLIYIPLPEIKKIIDAAFYALKDNGIFWHICYTPSKKLFKLDNVMIKKRCTQWLHFPTGFVYEFKHPRSSSKDGKKSNK